MYISTSDLYVPEDVLIRLTDDEASGSVNSARIDDAITSAQAVVDASLSRQYAVPLSDPPQLVKKLTADIALYNLYLRQVIVPAEVKDSYAGALATLDALANGSISLPLSGPVQPFQSPAREFSRDSMKGF